MPGRLQDAIAEYRKAIAEYQTATCGANPNLWQAHFNLGLAYAQIPGREADAIAEYRTALRMKPDSALAHFHLGNTFHKMGRLPEAIAEYQASLSIDPAVPEVHYELAYALAQIPGRVPEAIAECRKMLLLKPGDEAGPAIIGVVAWPFKTASAGSRWRHTGEVLIPAPIHRKLPGYDP